MKNTKQTLRSNAKTTYDFDVPKSLERASLQGFPLIVVRCRKTHAASAPQRQSGLVVMGLDEAVEAAAAFEVGSRVPGTLLRANH